MAIKKDVEYKQTGFLPTVAKTLATVNDPIIQMQRGIAQGVEGIGDFFLNLTGIFGSKEYKDWVQKKVAEDNAGNIEKFLFDNWVTSPQTKLYEFLAEKANKAGNKDLATLLYSQSRKGSEELSYFNNTTLGEKWVDPIAQSIGGMILDAAIGGGVGSAAGAIAGKAGAGAAKVASATAKAQKVTGLATLGVRSAGNATGEAYKEGATYGRGTLYGLAQGGTEAATELMFDSPINKVYSSGFLRPVASTIAGKIIKGMAGEAIEEATAELVNPLEKAIYKGGDALSEYGTGDYWKGVGRASATGALTAGVTGVATGSYSHANMASEFINDAQTEITKRANQEANGKLDAKKEATSKKKIQSYLQAAEKNLTNMSEAKRADFFAKNAGASTIFTEDGKIRPEFARRTWGGQSAAETENGAQAQNAGLSLNVRYDTERVGNVINDSNQSFANSKDKEIRGMTISVHQGELTSEQSDAFQTMKRMVNNLNNSTGNDIGIVVVDSSKEGVFNAFHEKKSDIIVVDASALGSKTMDTVHKVAEIAVEEIRHSSQIRDKQGRMTKSGFDLLANLMDTKQYEQIVNELTSTGNRYGFTKEMYKNLLDKGYLRWNDLTEEEKALADEIDAKTAARVLSGDKAFIYKYAENHTAAGNMINALEKVEKWLSRVTSKEARTEYKRVESVKKTFLEALAEKGYTYRDGKVISVRPPEEKENTAEAVENDEAVRFSFKNSQNGMANDKLLAYSEEMRGLIEQNGNIIIDSPAKLQEVVDMAFDNPTKKATAYFGILTTDVLQKIEDNIPNMPRDVRLFQEGREYSVATTLDNIRHLVDEKNLSRGEVLDYLDRLADTIADFDSVAYSVYEQNGSHGILCKKRFADGTLISYSLVSNKRKTLKMQTIYLDSKDYQNKKRSLPTPADAKAPAYTPKARGGQTSDNSISQSSENVNPQSEKSSQENFDVRFSRAATPTAEDTQYLEAVKKGYMEAAGKMVENAAKKAGYNSPVLYHGTNSFGFTVFDLAKMDDGRSIFLTDSERIASTYSETGRREINSKIELPENLSPVIIASELNAYMTDQEKELGYKYMSFSEKSMKNLIGRNRVELSKLRGYLNGYDFDDSNQKRSFNQLLEELSKEYDAKNNNISTPLYLLINNTNLFDDYSEIDVSQLESNIRLAKELSDFLSKETEAIAMIGMDGYDIEILPVNEAKEKLQNILTKGTYALFVPLKNKVSINAEGKRWNALKYKADVSYAYQVIRGAHGYRIYNTFTNDTYYLADNQSGEFDTREEAEKKLKEIKSDDSYKYATLDTTRQISKWAKEYGYDGVIFENIMDNGGRNVNVPIDETANIYVIFSPNEAKSADPVTYDDDGNVIPLSERFNEQSEDIRFSRAEQIKTFDKLQRYTDEETKSIESDKRNMIAKSYADIINFFNQALAGNINTGKTLFVGKISDKTADKILAKAGIETHGKSIALNSNDIRHMIKEHGDETGEAKRGQEAISENNFGYVLETIANPDEVSSDRNEKSGVLSLTFKKEIGGRTTAITIFSEKRKTLTLKTAWITKKEQHISQPTNAEALVRTPEARSSMNAVFNDSISQNSDLSRGSDKKSDVSFSKGQNAGEESDVLEGLTQGQRKKVVANNTMDRVFTRIEAQDEINRIVDEVIAKKYGDTVIKGGRQSLVNRYWIDLNKSNGFSRDAIARKIADYMIENAMVSQAVEEMDYDASATGEEIAKKAKRIRLNSMDSAEVEKMRSEIVKELLTSFNRLGSESTFSKNTTRKIKLSLWNSNIAKELQGYIDGKGEYVAADILNAPEMKEWIRTLKPLAGKAIYGKEARDVVEQLSKFYNDENELLEGYLDENVEDAIKFILENKDSKAMLSTEEMEALHKILAGMRRLYKTYDRITLAGRSVSLTDTAMTAHEQISKARRKATTRTIVGRLKNLLSTEMVEPRVVIEALEGFTDDGILSKAFRDIQNGETRKQILYMQMMYDFDEFMDKKYKKRLYKDYIEFRGQKLSVGQAITLHELAKRDQAKLGLSENGITYEDEKYAKHSIKAITDEELSAMSEKFTEQDKEFIKITEHFFNEVASEIKKIADQENLGYTNALEEFYFPILREKMTIRKAITDTRSMLSNMVSLYSYSFNKDVRKNAKNALYIGNVYDIITNHAEQLSSYAGLYAPMKSFEQLYNKNIAKNKGLTGVISVRQNLNDNVWDGTDSYISKLMSDISGTTPTESSPIFDYIRSAYAKFQLGANVKTFLSQIASYPQAFTELDMGSLVKGFVMVSNHEDMDKYCPYAAVRNYNKGIVKAEGVLDKIGKVGDTMTKPIQVFDRITIGKLWNACQYQVQKDSGLQIGTEENKVKAGKMLEDVIRKTQPDFNTSERSGLMRSQNVFKRAAVMFTSAQLKQLSRLVESVGKLSYAMSTGDAAKIKAARIQVARSSSAVLMSVIAYTLLGMLAKALFARLKASDKEPEEKFEALAKEFGADMLSGGVGLLPIVRDIYTAVSSKFLNNGNGYEINSFYYDVLNNVVNAGYKAAELAVHAMQGKNVEDYQFWSVVKNTTNAVGQLTGIPTRNLYNEITGLVKRVSPSAGYTINTKFYNANYVSDMNKALENGDEQRANTIMNLMMSERMDGTSTSQINRSVLELYKKGYNVLPRTVGDSINYDGQEYKLTARQKARFQKVYGQASAAVQKVVALQSYRKLSDEVKAKTIKRIYDMYYNLAIDDLLGTDTEDKTVLFSYAIDPDKLALIIAQAQSLQADTDKSGKPIAGSKKQKVVDYVNGLKLSAAQKYMIMGYLGYKNAKGEAQVQSYVNNLKLSKKEKEMLMEYSGY